jgi:hypothetical protein
MNMKEDGTLETLLITKLDAIVTQKATVSHIIAPCLIRRTCFEYLVLSLKSPCSIRNVTVRMRSLVQRLPLQDKGAVNTNLLPSV